jgi:hypothetical protein
VIGIILAFDELGNATAAAGTGAASQVASAAVMSAIAEALVATAVGIGVALPAVAAYNYFQRRITSILDDADTLSNLVLAYLSSKGAPSNGRTAHEAAPVSRREASRSASASNKDTEDDTHDDLARPEVA